MTFETQYDLAVITGPTATGKTNLASMLAYLTNGEVISADSRQVYRQMTIGTGKDLADFIVNGKNIPYHLIDIHNAGYHYNVFEFQKDFLNAYNDIQNRNAFPILCGGTGLYIEAALKRYRMIEVPPDEELRKQLELESFETLVARLLALRPLHNQTDTTDRQRLIRAIEIEIHSQKNPHNHIPLKEMNACLFAIHFERETIRQRITQRLELRLAQGMIEEVKALLDSGLSFQTLDYYGLEYRYISQYLLGQISYQQMFQLLNTAIHQFAKRQMTWFRKMQKDGLRIHWIDGSLGLEDKISFVLDTLRQPI